MKALLISRDMQLHAEIASQGAARVSPMHVVASRASVRDALDRPLREHPGAVIVDISEAGPTDADLLLQLTSHYAGAHFMLLADSHHSDFLIKAMRAGVREVLQLPLVRLALHEAIDRMIASAGAGITASAGVVETHEGQVLAFIGCKGGSGATFISSNFGYALATLAGKRVLLIDLHRQFGDAALYVSEQKPTMTLSDVCQQIARIDGQFLDSCLVHVAPGFGVLAAAEDPGQSAQVLPEQVDALLRVARENYDYVLLDVGRQIDAVSLRVLDQADAIYPVLQLALPDIRHARRLLDIFRSLDYATDHIRLIVNRYQKGGRLRLQDLNEALGAEVLHTVPNDYATVTDSINQGVPVLQLARASAAARSLVNLVEVVTARPVVEPKGLFDRLFG